MIKKIIIMGVIFLTIMMGTINAGDAATTTSTSTSTVSPTGSNLSVDLSNALLSPNSVSVTSLNMLLETSPQVTGYMSQAQAADVLGGTFPALNTSYSQYPANTAIYQRSWSTGGLTSSFAVVIGVEVQNPGLAGELLSQINSQNPMGGKATKQSTFIVQSIPEAEGFHQEVNGTGTTVYDTWAVTFLNSNVVFEVYLISPQPSFTRSQIVTLAQAQYQKSVYDIPAVSIPSTTVPPATTVPVTTPKTAGSGGISPILIVIPILIVLAGAAYLIKLKLNQRARRKLWESRGLAHAMQVQSELTKSLNDLDKNKDNL
jgi:hypothetical protein